jgi:hypothetical protein
MRPRSAARGYPPRPCGRRLIATTRGRTRSPRAVRSSRIGAVSPSRRNASFRSVSGSSASDSYRRLDPARELSWARSACVAESTAICFVAIPTPASRASGMSERGTPLYEAKVEITPWRCASTTPRAPHTPYSRAFRRESCRRCGPRRLIGRAGALDLYIVDPAHEPPLPRRRLPNARASPVSEMSPTNGLEADLAAGRLDRRPVVNTDNAAAVGDEPDRDRPDEPSSLHAQATAAPSRAERTQSIVQTSAPAAASALSI